MDAIDRWDDSRPELLMIGFVKPHHPFDPPAAWASMYNPQKLDVLPGWMDHGLLRDSFQMPGWLENRRLTLPKYKKILAYYYALISEIDHHVGRFVAKLREKSLYENTMIVFTTDHGDYMGYHHMILKGNHMYEPVMKIPLVIKYPGGGMAGIENTALSVNTDIAATILSAAGVEPVDQMRGACDLGSGPHAGHDVVISFERLGARAMVRHGNYKLQVDTILESENTFHWGSIVPPRGELLFDLDKDPYEVRDISAENPEIVAHLKKHLHDFQGGNEYRGAFIADEFNAPIIKADNAQEATSERVAEGIDYFLSAFKKERGID
jgi:arylsulfatase A-like enzyme